MPKPAQTVASLTLNLDKPTTLTFKQLSTWVIWQIPTPINNALSGAVRPATPQSKWYPALIQVKEKKVQIHAHLNVLFDSPEDASEYLCKNHQKAK